MPTFSPSSSRGTFIAMTTFQCSRRPSYETKRRTPLSPEIPVIDVLTWVPVVAGWRPEPNRSCSLAGQTDARARLHYKLSHFLLRPSSSRLRTQDLKKSIELKLGSTLNVLRRSPGGHFTKSPSRRLCFAAQEAWATSTGPRDSQDTKPQFYSAVLRPFSHLVCFSDPTEANRGWGNGS